MRYLVDTFGAPVERVLKPESGSRRQLVAWVLVALGACSLLGLVLVWQHQRTIRRWSSFLVGDPHTGARLFFERKGCARCHAVNGVGAKLAPDLGYSRLEESNLSQLVTAMWNHAPRMWEKMRAEKTTYPQLNREEMAHLFAFLYTAKYVDEPGDVYRGKRLFDTKTCIRCHSVGGAGGHIGPDLAAIQGFGTPIRWTQAMWNHAPAMEARMEKLGLDWVSFEGREMNDLLAYIRQYAGGIRRETELLPASPERGWQIFQSKSCVVCHRVNGKGGSIGPELGPNRKVPMTIVQFAGMMWNHSPQMWRTIQEKGVERPEFEGQEIADLVSFLSSLRYFEPVGSPQIGETLFADRGCSYCHGPQAQGSRIGPGLRGRGYTTSLTLATALWEHGPRMFRRTQEQRLPWPELVESDVGDIVAFLNSAPGDKP